MVILLLAESSLEVDVLRSVRELVRHPRGGKLEVFVRLTNKIGERAYKVVPLLTGQSGGEGTIRTDED